MNDPVLKAFLDAQYKEGIELARQSDLLDLLPEASGDDPPNRYLARFTCKGLVRGRDGEVTEASDFLVGIWFPSYYLRRVNPPETLTWLEPTNVWHPNIAAPEICVGKITPGTELVDLIYQIYEMITYFNWVPHDPLNPGASQWARNHQEVFPVDRRPLKRRKLNLKVTQKVPLKVTLKAENPKKAKKAEQ